MWAQALAQLRIRGLEEVLFVCCEHPRVLPGRSRVERIVRRGTKWLHEFAGAIVPRITLVTRKSYWATTSR
jgi:acetyl-CoA carboxylase carboxyltransferase component